MNPQITDADLQQLLSLNPLASEQLRRIIAERNKAELQAELAELKKDTSEESDNGVVSEDVLTNRRLGASA
jgi:hypothetical protein|tara:strand:+ start:3333 stop:3545 length:213 start_codon:yes stop_codon:yes gene_type:complete